MDRAARVVSTLVLVLALVAASGPARGEVGEVTGLPLPRFVSLATEVANLRLGPRRSYDVVAIYRRHGLPLQIVGEFGNWREVVDFEGARGWVHGSLLSGRRTVMVRGEAAVLRRGAVPEAPAMARLAPGVVARLLRCEAGAAWCFVEVDGRRGWLARVRLWGVGGSPTS
ncbi:MAG: aspartyl-trna synthetase [Alphaproteobacteria bacterium]|nr:aspartyl-trna synthetase [Alphaproteobacteria bacterium]